MIERIFWIALWLACGMLAAYEIGLRNTAVESDPALAVFYAAMGALGLWMMVRRAVRARRPSRLVLPLALSLAGPAGIAWLTHQRKPPPEWIGTLFGASTFLAFSGCVIVVGLIIAWRRRESDRDRHHRALRQSVRQQLEERPSSGPMQEIADELEHPPAVDDADLLPAGTVKR